MMKPLNYFMLRTVMALILGLVLILWPSDALVWLAVTIGILFIVPGLIALIGYFARDRQTHPDMRFPVTGTGSLMFGLSMVVVPTFFINMLMYILGAILIGGGIEQIVMLAKARKRGRVSPMYYAAPALILTAGVVVLVNPFRAAEKLRSSFWAPAARYTALRNWSHGLNSAANTTRPVTCRWIDTTIHTL